MKDYVKDCQLNFVRIKFSPKLKVVELKYLCESHGLLLKPEEEVEFVEEKRFCIVKCAFRKAMNYDNEQFKLLQNDVECMVQIISKRLRRSSLVIAYHFTHPIWKFLIYINRPIRIGRTGLRLVSRIFSPTTRVKSLFETKKSVFVIKMSLAVYK